VAETLVDTHQAFYRISLYQKGWRIPTKHFIEYHFWHKTAGGNLPSILENLIFALKGWWIPTYRIIKILDS
jgi:hypothetical protein